MAQAQVLDQNKLANAIINEKKYILTYHKHRDLLYPMTIQLILDIESKLKRIPPLSITKEEILSCEEHFHILVRKIAGFYYHLGLETIKEGFGIDNFANIYNKQEREEIANFIFDQQEGYLNNVVRTAIINHFKDHPKLLIQFINQQINEFTQIFALYNKQIFISAFLIPLTTNKFFVKP